MKRAEELKERIKPTPVTISLPKFMLESFERIWGSKKSKIIKRMIQYALVHEEDFREFRRMRYEAELQGRPWSERETRMISQKYGGDPIVLEPDETKKRRKDFKVF